MSLRNPVRGLFIVLLTAVTALPFLAAPAHAAPGDGRVGANVQTDRDQVRIRLLNGSLGIDGGYLVYRNDAGTVVDRTALNYIAPDNRTYPIDAAVNGRVATLTPSKDASRSVATDAALLRKTDVADKDGYRSKKERDDAALARFNSEMAASMTISTIVGTAIGVVLGGFAGCVLTLPIGCLPGLTAGAGLGGIAGTVVGGGGSAIAAGQRYFDTINRPFRNVKPNRR
ncbi:hypothetical protein [Gordonia neofelifaecis]|uniref:DUF8020 domain-containing protein n=1 Tax=Gordonia neofelifaecis NRRL B-59395 TaxID=644548 RepID=F1YLP7_9ACTN|nr:hypothetical protein [Gordonia neofelifaecis]EGD54441.1 hypothetical protein SCNU_14204 [Gordonia neofelifaecis NRRL B-59395]